MTQSRFNLITNNWIPLKRASGTIEFVAPWRITEYHDKDPFVSPAYPRPEFNGAILEFLIGLLSTIKLVENEDQWEEFWFDPPELEEIQSKMVELQTAFFLDGTEHRFMQDSDQLISASKKPVHSLLIDEPGSQTVKRNADLFIKRGRVRSLSRSAAAIALYTLNTYAPAGGAGHRTSMRGGGPLTTLAIFPRKDSGTTIWSRIWPNVETVEQVKDRGSEYHEQFGQNERNLSQIFPWMGQTKESKNNLSTHPSDIHPLHVYWGMPRRIRLEFTNRNESTPCAILGDVVDKSRVESYRTLNYGFNYEYCPHPLTPYYEKKTKGVPLKLPQHPQIGGITYRQWPGMVFDDKDQGSTVAFAIHRAKQRADSVGLFGSEMRVAAFGFDMENMKSRSWIQSEMPLLVSSSETSENLSDFVNLVVTAAEKASLLLTNGIKRALYPSVSAPSGTFGHVKERFFRESEASFYEAFSEAAIALENKEGEIRMRTETVRVDWAIAMRDAALRLYDEYVLLDENNFKSIEPRVRERFSLSLTLAGRGKAGKTFYSALDIPPPEPRSKSKSGNDK